MQDRPAEAAAGPDRGHAGDGRMGPPRGRHPPLRKGISAGVGIVRRYRQPGLPLATATTIALVSAVLGNAVAAGRTGQGCEQEHDDRKRCLHALLPRLPPWAGCRARGGARRAGRPAGHEAFQNRHFLDEPIRSKLSFCRVSGKDDRGYGFRCLSPIDTTPKSTFDPTFPGRTPIPGGMGGFTTTEGSSECRAEG